MRRIIAGLLCAAALPAAAGYKIDAIRNCRLDWPSSTHLQALCVDHEKAARKALRKLSRKGALEAQAVAMCIDVSPGAAQGVDYGDALRCARYSLKRMRR